MVLAVSASDTSERYGWKHKQLLRYDRGMEVKIDHGKIIDGFQQLKGQRCYVDYETKCAECGKRFVLTADAQKYLHEVNRVPVKQAKNAAFCAECLPGRRAEKHQQADKGRAQRLAQEADAALAKEPHNSKVLSRWFAARFELLELGPTPHSIDDFIARARQAQKQPASPSEAVFWEAQALLLRGDTARAKAAFERFTARANTHRQQVAVARKIIARLQSQSD